jgi:hypothetical protein
MIAAPLFEMSACVTSPYQSLESQAFLAPRNNIHQLAANEYPNQCGEAGKTAETRDRIVPGRTTDHGTPAVTARSGSYQSEERSDGGLNDHDFRGHV